MNQPTTIVLLDDHRRRMALDAVRKAHIGQQVKISRATRTTDQNAHLHSLLGQVAAQVPDPATGELRDIEFWKPRATLSWLVDKKREYEIITPFHRQSGALEVGILVPHTSDLTTEQCAELIEWIYSYFTTEKGVVFKEREEPPPREEP